MAYWGTLTVEHEDQAQMMEVVVRHRQARGDHHGAAQAQATADTLRGCAPKAWKRTRPA